MGLVLLLVLGVLVGLLWFGFIGGLAGAVTGGGREDRSLLVNAGIGLAGSLLGGTLWYLITQEELRPTMGGFLSSLLGAIALLALIEIRKRKSSTTPTTRL